MKRLLLALVLASIVFGGVYGLAESLGVSTQTLGAGNTAVAACQSGTLTSSYATTYDSTIPGYEVTTVTIGGLQSGCYSKAYKITLTNSSNVSLVETTGTAPASGTTITTSSLATSNVPASILSGIHVTITG
jgi:hypothetical protein